MPMRKLNKEEPKYIKNVLDVIKEEEKIKDTEYQTTINYHNSLETSNFDAKTIK